MWADPYHLRGNHYYLRSIEEGLEKALYWGKSKSAATMRGTSTIKSGATQFFESIYDGSILQWWVRVWLLRSARLARGAV